MLETELIGKTVNCILCRGSILYFNETEFQKFCRHLQFEHSVMYDFDFMLAACKMTDSEKSALSSVFNKKSPDPSPEGGGGGAGDTNAAPASASSTATSTASSKMFKNQARNKSKLNQRKQMRTTVPGKKQSVGNNVIDVKSFKVTKFSCQKCSKKFKTRTKLMKHKTRKHSSLTRQKKQQVPTAKQKLAASEAMQQQSVIGAGAAGRAADAVMKVSLFPPSASSTQTPARAPAPLVTKTPPSAPPPASKQEVEIKIEKEEAEIVDIAPKTPSKTNNDNKTPPPPDKRQKHQFLTEIGLTKNGGSVATSTSSAKTNVSSSSTVSSVSSPSEVSTPVTETSTPDPAQSEPSCSTCVELANSASKLSRHKRYVHEDKTKSPSTSEKARRESIREAKKASSRAESEPTADTDPTPAPAASEDVPPPRVVAETPLRPCLKRSNSVPRRLSVSFNESVSFSDQTEAVEKDLTSVSPKRGRGRPKKSDKVLQMSETEVDKIVEEAKLSPVSKKPKISEEKPIEDLNSNPSPSIATPISQQPSEKITQSDAVRAVTDLIRSSLNAETNPKVNVVNNLDDIIQKYSDDLAKTSQVITLDAEPNNPVQIKESNRPKASEQVKATSKQQTKEKESPKPTEGVPNIFILRQCELCPEMFTNSQQLLSHRCVAGAKEVQEVAVVQELSVEAQEAHKEKTKEKNNIVANVLREDKSRGARVPNMMPTTLDEEAVIIVEPEPEVVEPIIVEPKIVAPKYVLDSQQLVTAQQSSMVKLPYDSFLETVLVEDTQNKSVLTVEELRTHGQGGGPETVVISTDTFDDLSPLDKLLFKYRQPSRQFVDFTKSNFFMKNAEMIGGKGNGTGFKEFAQYLPEGWKVKTYNEYKKFFFTPECIVLKSCTAVIEYLRLKYDLAQEDLKTLAEYLSINSNIFNRYLDELFDDCVVLE